MESSKSLYTIYDTQGKGRALIQFDTVSRTKMKISSDYLRDTNFGSPHQDSLPKIFPDSWDLNSGLPLVKTVFQPRLNSQSCFTNKCTDERWNDGIMPIARTKWIQTFSMEFELWTTIPFSVLTVRQPSFNYSSNYSRFIIASSTAYVLVRGEQTFWQFQITVNSASIYTLRIVYRHINKSHSKFPEAPLKIFQNIDFVVNHNAPFKKRTEDSVPFKTKPYDDFVSMKSWNNNQMWSG